VEKVESGHREAERGSKRRSVDVDGRGGGDMERGRKKERLAGKRATSR
jgi:hypothetical protein